MNLIWRQSYINLFKKNYTETNKNPNPIQKLVIPYDGSNCYSIAYSAFNISYYNDTALLYNAYI